METFVETTSFSKSRLSSDVPQEIYKVLIGWISEPVAVKIRSTCISATSEEHSQAVLASSAKVAARPEFVPTNPITEINESDLVKALKLRPEYAYLETEITNAGGTCRIALVNLQEVIAFQHLVRVDHLEGRQVQGSIGDEQLYEICFPAYRPVSADEVTIEPNANGNGYIVTTLDPNIKVIPWQSIPGVSEQLGFKLGYPSSSVTMDIQLLSFPLLRIPNYIIVVHYRDRYIMRNGYTRATELLSQGIKTVPCMVIEGQNPALIGLKQGMFDLGTIMSGHPPRLTDFWDDTVTCLLKRPALRYVYDVSVNMIPAPR